MPKKIENSNTILISHKKEVLDALNAKKDIILEALALEAEGNAMSEVNKLVYDTPPSPNYQRTGRLKSSISHETSEDSAIIGSNVEYAPYVEYGSHGVLPRPFLKNAIENYEEDYKKIIEDGLK